MTPAIQPPDGDTPDDDLPGTVVADLREFYLRHPRAAIAKGHLAAMASVYDPVPFTRSRRGMWVGALAAGLFVLVGFTALAGAGELPAPVQDAVAAIVSPIGIDVPDSDEKVEDDDGDANEGGDADDPDSDAPPSSTGGQSEDAPGQGGTTPGQSEDAPGQDGTTPGQSEDAPGQGGTTPGQSEDAPGQGGTTPGQSEDAPGQQDNPGNSDATPGPPQPRPLGG